ncbi:MAG: hypothetical protein LBR79_04035 [Oscillospiraceae bacterium]|nr:hypothetical protein [Oscillospiraceae bacterium]
MPLFRNVVLFAFSSPPSAWGKIKCRCLETWYYLCFTLCLWRGEKIFPTNLAHSRNVRQCKLAIFWEK